MSEPVTNAEIEDVLSSIRRLVSENAGAIRRGPAEEEASDKLVLTPAFRVDESEPAATQEVAADDDGEVVSLDSERWTQDGEPIESQALEAEEHDTQPDAEARDWDAAEVEEIPQETGETDAAEPKAAVDHPEPEPEQAEAAPEPEAEPEAATLERRVAELEAAIDSSDDDFEPDGSEDEDMPDHVAFHHVPRDPEPEVEATEAVEAVVAAEPAPEVEPEPEAEAVEDAAQEWEDVAPEPEVAAQPEASVEDDVEQMAAEVVDDDLDEDDETDVIDEDMLRAMVAGLVRDELQGTVGERITKNVRRMVRREIARAMALQDFE